MERDQAVRLTQNLLKKMVENNGSDLFITAGFPPAIKIDGSIRPFADKPLTAAQSSLIVRSIMNDKQAKEFDATKEGPTTFDIGSVTVAPIALSHPNGGSGYKFIEDGKSFVFLTDNELGYIHPGGLGFNDYLEFAGGADLLMHDAEYTPEEYSSYIEWGHSVYTAALDLAMKGAVAKLGLFHINQERTDEQMDEIVRICRDRINAGGDSLECVGVGAGMEFEL